MAPLGQRIVDSSSASLWTITSPYQMFCGNIFYHSLEHDVPVQTCRAEITNIKPTCKLDIGSHKSFDVGGYDATDEAKLVEIALLDAAEIFEVVAKLVQTGEAYTRMLVHQLCGFSSLDIMSKLLSVLLAPQRFVVELRTFDIVHLKQRQLTPPRGTLWVEFTNDTPTDNDSSIATWYDSARNVITLHWAAPTIKQEPQGLPNRNVTAGTWINDLLTTLTSTIIEQLIYHFIFDSDSNPNPQNPSSSLPVLTSTHCHLLTPQTFTRVIVLSYLQAKHPFLDFLSHPKGVVQAKNPALSWSPIAQEVYRKVRKCEPTVEARVVYNQDFTLDQVRDFQARGGRLRTVELEAILARPAVPVRKIVSVYGWREGEDVVGGSSGRVHWWREERNQEEMWWCRLIPAQEGENYGGMYRLKCRGSWVDGFPEDKGNGSNGHWANKNGMQKGM